MFFFRYKHIKKSEDSELISRYRQTNKSLYLEVIFDRYFHLVYGVCLKYLKNKEESKEAVMLIFEKFENELLLNDLLNIKSWLFTVSRNQCLSIIKSKKKKFLSENGVDFSLLNEVYSEEELEENKFEPLIDNIGHLILQLKEGQRKCIQLFFIENKSYKEITEITGYDLKQVKSLLQNGKRSLGIMINEQLENEKG
ncbi:MAG: sigma-70 family RNA polymerase sigma factor [Bacteroidota bacterium]|nr:sigma-70 family RNA polymerase sigma factor [Bacteroidota bacterium]